ncbi:ly6/PLAUR domain-containing protein 6B-like [Tachypleus tridentatus]|uniref:ly6/PLAUR domain-containing protein 6B-like n=1 Tax=Tachypleus tridentatus TaxID=6853 RepID=UPI003FD57C1D
MLKSILFFWWFTFLTALVYYTGSVSQALTCYTCSNKTRNHDCNRYAVDRPCSQDQSFCYTKHVMDEYGETALVVKSCATSRECNLKTVGCYFSTNSPIKRNCVSCCDVSYCNREIPTNETNAILQMERQDFNSGFRTVFYWAFWFIPLMTRISLRNQ